MTEKSFGRCKQAGCNAAVTGVCIDNLKLDECPNFGMEAAAENSAPAERSDTTSADEFVTVSGGEAFSAENADAFLRARAARLIALVGGPEVGKTTLLATTYEMLRRRMFRNLTFAGCDTIRGFERRCHLSRMASGRAEPETPHTSRRSPVAFLHLRVVRDGRDPDNLMISDRTGEDFNDVLDRPERCVRLPELGRCDSVVLLVDGAKLADKAHASFQLSRARRLFMCLHQHGLIIPERPVQVVLTKLDILERSEERESGIERLQELGAELRERGGKDIDLSVHRVAARPIGGFLPLGTGLEGLMQEWLPMHPALSYISPIVGADRRKTNAFDALMDRFSAEVSQ
jgi:hypothetical protein